MQFIQQFGSEEKAKFIFIQGAPTPFASSNEEEDGPDTAAEYYQECREALLEEAVAVLTGGSVDLDGVRPSDDDIRAEAERFVKSVFGESHRELANYHTDGVISNVEVHTLFVNAQAELRKALREELIRDWQHEAAGRAQLEENFEGTAIEEGSGDELYAEETRVEEELQMALGHYRDYLPEVSDAYQDLGEAQGRKAGLDMAQGLIEGDDGLEATVLAEIDGLDIDNIDLSGLQAEIDRITSTLDAADLDADTQADKLASLKRIKELSDGQAARAAELERLTGDENVAGSVEEANAALAALQAKAVDPNSAVVVDQIEINAAIDEANRRDARRVELQREDEALAELLVDHGGVVPADLDTQISDQTTQAEQAKAKADNLHRILDPVLAGLGGDDGTQGIIGALNQDRDLLAGDITGAREVIVSAFAEATEALDAETPTEEEISDLESAAEAAAAELAQRFETLQDLNAQHVEVEARISRYEAYMAVSDQMGEAAGASSRRVDALEGELDTVPQPVERPAITATTLRMRPAPGLAKDNIYKTDKPGGEGVVTEGGNHTFYLNNRNPERATDPSAPKYMDDSQYLSWAREVDGSFVTPVNKDGYTWYKVIYNGPRGSNVEGWVALSSDQGHKSYVDTTFEGESFAAAEISSRKGTLGPDAGSSLKIRTGKGTQNDVAGYITKDMDDIVEVVNHPGTDLELVDAGNYRWAYVRIRDKDTNEIKVQGFAAARNITNGDVNLEIA